MAGMQGYDQGAEGGARQDFELLPEGDYTGVIDESDIGSNSKNTGQVLSLTWVLTSEGYKGRKVWQRINISHTSAKAQEIGQRELANVKRATGFIGILADTLQLHNKPAGLRLKIELPEAGSQYKPKNVVFDTVPVAELGGAVPQQAPAAQQQQPAQATAPAPVAAPAAPAANNMPWLKKG